ncbi:MAG: hypothetical protein U0031_21565 [Thermomicrobiales bacterium]
MITQQQLRKSGNSYVVTIPKDEVERHGWREGEFLSIQVTQLSLQPVLGADLQQALEERWERNEEALRYLADR